MKMAVNKCEYIIISNDTRKVQYLIILIYGQQIKRSSEVMLLGFKIDHRLKFKNHQSIDMLIKELLEL